VKIGMAYTTCPVNLNCFFFKNQRNWKQKDLSEAKGPKQLKTHYFFWETLLLQLSDYQHPKNCFFSKNGNYYQ
jgi:hypothetical protein